MEGYRKDARPAAEAVETLLADPSPEKAAALLQKLPELLPEDPAMAAILAEAMAEEYGVMSSEFRVPGDGVILNSECRAKDPATCRTHGAPNYTPEQKNVRRHFQYYRH